jgi:hypothetical protein
MDADKRSAQSNGLKWWRPVGGAVGPRKRGQHRPGELAGPRQVAATARRYGISRSLLLRWRQSFHSDKKRAYITELSDLAEHVGNRAVLYALGRSR